MSTKSFLPFLSESSEPLKIYKKLQQEFPHTDIGKLFTIVMDFGLAKVKTFISNFERTQESSQREFRLAIENHFAPEIDYKALGLVRSVISISPPDWFALGELDNKEDKIDFASLIFMANKSRELYFNNKILIQALDDREVILGNLKPYINLDSEAALKYKVSSLKELQAEVLLYAAKGSAAEVCFVMGDTV